MANEITVGTMVVAKVGRNEIPVEVIAAEDGTYTVKNKTGKEFKTRRIEAMPMESNDAVTTSNEAIESKQDQNCHERGSLSGKMSLLNAAVEVLRNSDKPLNTREIVGKAVADGLWNPTEAKTPEQTLYGAVFREIATKENPRIVKSAEKGKFQLG